MMMGHATGMLGEGGALVLSHLPHHALIIL